MYCFCCASTEFTQHTILWEGLINEWRLSPQEAAYINRQQGYMCNNCGCNLRSIALAEAIMRCFNYSGLFKDFVQSPTFQDLKVLEINHAGLLAKYLKDLPNVIQKSFPEIDMMELQFEDNSFDLVIHTDDLEHVKLPIRGLSECHRVVKPGRFCVFTIPIVVDRLTSTREGVTPSFHGPRDHSEFRVWTEFGTDAWEYVIQAGFPECRIVSLEYPTSLALIGVK